MAPLTLHLHGSARVVAADGRETVLERRAAALCALAALEPGFARERAAAWLWPDSADPRRNLRQQLLRFRQLFGRPLLEGETHLALAAGVALAAAAGGLLQDHRDTGSEEFAAWLAAQRQRAAAQAEAQGQQAVEAAEGAGDLDAALAAARRWLGADPGHENAAQALMRVHYLRGEAAAGLAVHQALTETMADRTGSRPGPATEALAETLRQSVPLPPTLATLATPPATRGLPVALKRPPLLAGREAECSAARAAWAEGRAVLLEGEAGLGKSRLVAELATGAQALQGKGRPGDAGVPYATAARWLAPLLAPGTADLAGADREALAHLQQAVGAPLRPGALPRAVAALLAARRVDLVAVDDLHFADEATLELLAGLASEDTPWRWLFAQRAAEATPAGRALRDSLVELGRLQLVTLAPLDEPAAAALLISLAIAGLDVAPLAPALVRHTGGNPLFLLETLKQGLLDGSLARGELPRPAQVGTLIERRLQRLGEPALALARVAAIAGVDFRLELAEAAIGQSAVQLASAWQELQDAQVLRDEAFAHDLVADAALKTVPAVIARRLHGQCATWLAAHGGEPARLAEHWWQAGQPLPAAEAFIAAGQRAGRAARLEEEAALYARAAEAFDAAGEPARAFDARCLRVRTLVGTDFGDRGLQEARALVAQARNDTDRLRAELVLVDLLSERSQGEEAVAVGSGALALARRLGDRANETRLACHLASALCRLGRVDEALAGLRPLREWVLAQPDGELVMLWHGDWAAALALAGRMRDAIAAYETAIDASRRAGLPDAQARLQMNCAVSLRQSGRLDRALVMARAGRALSPHGSEEATHDWIAQLVVAREESEGGHYASALAALEALVPKFEAAGTPFWAQACRMVLVQLWLHLGQFARALPLLREEPADIAPWLRADRLLWQRELALALGRPVPEAGSALALVAADGARLPAMRVRALRAQGAAVLAEADTLAAALQAQERCGALLALQVHRAQAALQAGRADLAASAADSVMALFDEGFAPDAMYRAEAWWTAHRAYAAAGRTDDAARALADGTRWVRQVALPQVPDAFVESFLHRNEVNRALLAAAAG